MSKKQYHAENEGCQAFYNKGEAFANKNRSETLCNKELRWQKYTFYRTRYFDFFARELGTCVTEHPTPKMKIIRILREVMNDKIEFDDI